MSKRILADNMNKLLLLITGILSSLYLLPSSQGISPISCLEYHQAERTIEISCGTANVTDLYKEFGSSIIKSQSPKVWVLNENIRINDDTTFYINSTDTLWLKINSTSGNPYSIISQGNLRIDSVKLTSWDTTANIYDKIGIDGMKPRAYIRAEKGTGT